MNNPINFWDLLGMLPNQSPTAGAKADELIDTLADGTKVWKTWESTDGYQWDVEGELFYEMPAFDVKDNKSEPAVLPKPIYDALVDMAPAMDLGADIAQAILDNYNVTNLVTNGAKKALTTLAVKGGKKLLNQQTMTPKQAAKGIRSIEKEIAKHEKKLEDFKQSPTVRPGMEHQPPEVIAAQQQQRIQDLTDEIATFKENIDKLKKIIEGGG